MYDAYRAEVCVCVRALGLRILSEPRQLQQLLLRVSEVLNFDRVFNFGMTYLPISIGLLLHVLFE